jgi:hypothetical protein
MSYLQRPSSTLISALKRIPGETLITSAAVVGFSAAMKGDAPHTFLVIALAAIVAAPLVLSITLLHRAGTISKTLRGAASIIMSWAVLAYLFQIGPTEEHLQLASFGWRYASTLIAACMCPFLAIAVVSPREERMARFSAYLRKIIEAGTIYGFLTVAGLIAVAIIGGSAISLYDLHAEDFFLRIALCVVGFGVVLFLDRASSPYHQSEEVPPIWQALVRGVGAPFVAIMLVLLYLYQLGALVAGEIPQNQMSPMIMGAGFVGFLSALIIQSMLVPPQSSTTELRAAVTPPWQQSFSIRIARIFPVALLALLPLAIMALGMRIEQYGVTPFRFTRLLSLACLAVLSVIGTVQLVRRRSPLSWHVPAVVGVCAAINALFAVPVSTNSQVRRLEEMLVQAKVDNREVSEERPEATVELGSDVYWELSSQIDTVYSLGGRPALERVLTGATHNCTERYYGDRCLEHLGITSAHHDSDSRHSSRNDPVKTPTHTVVTFTAWEYDGGTAVADYNFQLDYDRIYVRHHGKPVGHVVLHTLLHSSEHEPLPDHSVPVVHEGRVVGDLVIDEVGRQRRNGLWRLSRVSGIFLHHSRSGELRVE